MPRRASVCVCVCARGNLAHGPSGGATHEKETGGKKSKKKSRGPKRKDAGWSFNLLRLKQVSFTTFDYTTRDDDDIR